jgi:hypothetical protein
MLEIGQFLYIFHQGTLIIVKFDPKTFKILNLIENNIDGYDMIKGKPNRNSINSIWFYYISEPIVIMKFNLKTNEVT